MGAGAALVFPLGLSLISLCSGRVPRWTYTHSGAGAGTGIGADVAGFCGRRKLGLDMEILSPQQSVLGVQGQRKAWRNGTDRWGRNES